MQVAFATRDVQLSAGLETTRFKIPESAASKIAHMVIDGLYTNKLRCLDELVGNAYDEQAYSSRPPYVHLPTKLEPWLEVRDWGRSMDHEFMTTRYTHIWDSTKDGQNATDTDDPHKAIGGWGQGRLSALAVVEKGNHYTIICRRPDAVRTYAVFRDEIGMPALTCLGEDAPEADGSTGTSVIVPIPLALINEFVQAARNNLRYYDPLPECNLPGTVVPPLYSTGSPADGFGLERGGRDMSLVIMGGYPYPLDLSKLTPPEGKRSWDDLSWRKNLRLFLPIRSCDVTSNRESLRYSEKTTAALNAALNGFQKRLYQQLRDDLAKRQTWWEVAEWFATLAEEKYMVMYPPKGETRLTFKGVPITNGHIVQSVPEEIRCGTYSMRGFVSFEGVTQVTLGLTNLFYIVDDTSVRDPIARIKRDMLGFVRSHDKWNRSDRFHKGAPSASYVIKDPALLDEWGVPEENRRYVSELYSPGSAKSGRAPYRLYATNDGFIPVSHEPPTGAVYVPLFGGDVVAPYTPGIIRSLLDGWPFNDGSRPDVWGKPATRRAPPQGQLLLDFVKAKVEATLKTFDFPAMLSVTRELDAVTGPHADFLQILRESGPYVDDDLNVILLRWKSSTYNPQFVRSVMSKLELLDLPVPTPVTTDLKERMHRLLDKLPMLSLLSQSASYYRDPRSQKTIRAYVTEQLAKKTGA